MAVTCITSGALAAALGWSVETVQRAAERGAMGTFERTPGGAKRKGHLRWAPAEAVRLVMSAGREPPKEWGRYGQRAPRPGALPVGWASGRK